MKYEVKEVPKAMFYATVGAGDLVVEKSKQLRTTELRRTIEQAGIASLTTLSKGLTAYDELVKRGETTVRRVRSSAPTKRAVTQSKVARSQSKAAATSIKKAATSAAGATKNAASTL